MEIAAGKFKAQCLKLMDQVKETHAPLIITKHGKPIAKLIPFNNTQASTNNFGRLKGSLTINNDIVSPIRENWEAEQ